MAETSRTTEHERNVAQQTTDDEALCKVLRARFQQAESHESRTRDDELEDLKFSAGEQWDPDLEAQRAADNRPCLTINQMPQFIRQVTNEERQNRPSIRIIPVDDVADPETAKIIQGLVRHIELDSDADIAYDTAFEAAVRSGKGYFRIITEFEDERSFHQVIKIRRIRNRFTVYLDPASQMPDGSDADWGIIIQPMSRDVFRDLYPDAKASDMTEYTTTGDGWIMTDEVRLAEYFYRERQRDTIVLLRNRTGTGPDVVQLKSDPVPDDMRVVAEREVLTPVIHWVKSNGHEVLDRRRFPGRFIPIVPVLGDELDINGEVLYEGLVRHAKDAQRMYNYWASSETETIALAPRSPFIGAEGQFEGHEQEWKAANRLNIAYLEYKPRTVGQELAPPPQRNAVEPPILAITQARLMSRDDLKATTGIHDASLGARSNETSGRAILARQREGDVANFHYPDNLTRSLRQAGRILVWMIPEVYNAARIVRILGEDDTSQLVTLNAPFQDDEGIDRLYDVRVGRYDVAVSTGPSFATKRQETVATQLELTKVFPALFQVAGDLLVKNMDWPGAQEIAERLVHLLPPELKPVPKDQDPKQLLAQLRAAVPHLEQQLQALNAYAKGCEEREQTLQQEVDQLKTAAASKAAELTVKQEENTAKLVLEEQKLELDARRVQIEQQQLELEEQKLALEVAKESTDIQEAHARIADLAVSQLRQELNTGNDAVSAVLQTLQGLLASLDDMQARIRAEREARQAPKTITVRRLEDGTLSSRVTTPGEGVRTVEIRPTENGFHGEVR